MAIAKKTENFIEEIVEKNIYNSNETLFIAEAEEQMESEGQIDLLSLNIGNSFGTAILENPAEISFKTTLDKITAEIKTTASSQFKGIAYIEPNEIENIKKMLVTEECDSRKKQELEKELTNFQKNITANYFHNLNEYKENRIDCIAQIARLEDVKKQLVMNRLSQMVWPYDQKTKEYDAKIANLKIQLARTEQKLSEIEAMSPAAHEKDILLFQVQLKEKFGV